MRIAAAVLFLAVASLVLESVLWLRRAPPAGTLDDPGPLVVDFEAHGRAEHEIDIATLYAGRIELLDPRLALPAWHKLPRDEAVRLHAATARCAPPADATPIRDPALAKALAWHEAICRTGAAPDDEIDRPPFMHPQGRSYAALALVQAPRHAGKQAHVRSFHVLELAALDGLDPADRALGEISAGAWEALVRGDRIVLDRRALVVAEHGPLGLAKLRIHSRDAWDTFARRRGVRLSARARSSMCEQPASPDLCWERLPQAERHRPALALATTSSAGLASVAGVGLVIAYARERRRVHRDRVHVLRTLTHELRTPATSLRVDIEPLRAAYDELPASCQEPMLRISDGIERLHRVLHRSARYMALFETSGGPREGLAKAREVASAREMFEEMSEEWPDGVSLVAGSEDSALYTDPDWLGVAARNLAENAIRHGDAPAVVTWAIAGDDLVVRVADGGDTSSFSLRRAVVPGDRDPDSLGLGLGLAIVDRIARLLGGKLSHEPSPTTFELRVPVRLAS